VKKITVLCFFLFAGFANAFTNGDADEVIVSQGGASVTYADVDAYMQRMPESDRPGFSDSPTRIETMLRGLLLDKQLAIQARERHLDKDALVQKQVSQAVDMALARARTQEFISTLKKPDFAMQAKEEFLTHKADYSFPQQANVEHILIKDEGREAAAAQELAEEVLAKAKAQPDQFQALVEQYSEDPSKAQNHGRVQNAGSNDYAPAFAEAARSLKKVGDISGIVRTPFGLHVLKLVEIVPPRQLSFEDAKSRIIERLDKEWTEQQIRDFLDNLRNNPFDADPDRVASLRERYRTANKAVPQPSTSTKAGH